MKLFIRRALYLLLPLALFTTLDAGIPPEQTKKILGMTKNSWVAFRNYNGKQLIYFTHLEAYTCGIKSVHYSINSEKLDRVWELQACNINNTNAVTKERPYLTFPLNSVSSITVQLIYNDGSKSAIIQTSP